LNFFSSLVNTAEGQAFVLVSFFSLFASFVMTYILFPGLLTMLSRDRMFNLIEHLLYLPVLF
jgi:hypothetical protein